MVADHLLPFILLDLQPITPSKSTLSTCPLKESTQSTIENKSLFPPTTTPTSPMMLLRPTHQASSPSHALHIHSPSQQNHTVARFCQKTIAPLLPNIASPTPIKLCRHKHLCLHIPLNCSKGASLARASFKKNCSKFFPKHSPSTLVRRLFFSFITFHSI